MSGNWPLSATSPKWVTEVSRQLDEAGIEYTLIDKIVGIFNCKSKAGGRSYRYYASGGVIVGSVFKGITSLIQLLTEGERYDARNEYSGYRDNHSNNAGRGFYSTPAFREIRNGRYGSGNYGNRANAYAYA